MDIINTILAIFVIIFTYILYPRHNRRYAGGVSRNLMSPQITFNDISHMVDYKSYESDPRILHVGQRKLMINEVQFLTEITTSKPIVIYAGAAPGNKTGFLSELFPDVTFLLVDPNKFDIRDANPVFLQPPYVSNFIMSGARINIINDLFTCELASELHDALASRNVYFISDIRTGMDDIHILWNNAQQYNWIMRLRPIAAMLKFRHIYYVTPHDELVSLSKQQPYFDDIKLAQPLNLLANTRTMTYFLGEIRLQPWAPRKSTETRLIVRQINSEYPITTYDSTTYENTMHAYNIDRAKPHVNENADLHIGFDHCGDCALENVIWKQYIAKHSKSKSRRVINYVKKLSYFTKRSLLRDNHGNL